MDREAIELLEVAALKKLFIQVGGSTEQNIYLFRRTIILIEMTF